MSNEADTVKKKSKRTLTPKLRFPEFRKRPGWKEVPLEQIAERTTTKNLDGSIARVLTNSAEHGILDQRDYFDKDIANAGNIDRYYIVDLGDYVYNPRISTLAPVGPISRNNIGKGVMSPLYTVFRFMDENTDFYQRYFKTVSWHLYVRRVSSMGARHDRMSITTGDFMAMPVPTPLPQEQQKIAECLSSLDGLIAAEGRMLEALKAHKKGLMQQLFPGNADVPVGINKNKADGDVGAPSQPCIRFPEFRDKGEWGEKKLSEITSAVFDGTHQTPTYTEAGIPFYSVENLISGNANKFISKEDYDLATKKNKPEKGDILLTRIGKIGFSQVVTWDHEFSVYVTLAVIKRSSQFNPHYLHCLMQSDFYQSELRSKSLSIAVPPKINMDSLRETKVLIPSPAEQQRIATCLTSLDTRIAAQAAKIDVLKQHKRGLMQQLFPAPEEP